MKGKRTEVEFENHELLTAKQDGLLIYELKKPNTLQGRIRFVNIEGAMVVLGDYGHWIFSRQFHPSDEGHVDDYYWLEKLESYSTQKGREYDSEELENGIDGGLEEYGYTGDDLETMKDFYESCKTFSDTEWEYVAFAHGDDKPNFIEHDQVPFAQRTKQWLLIVFDGFDEICRRMKNNEPIKPIEK